MNSSQKLEYIYQHFQDNKKIYESDPDLARCENDNTLYPYINNNIEYGLFEDVISCYYLDSQIKDDFKCDQECYTNTQEKQQHQPLTPYTHAYDHITQDIINLEDPIQQNTWYIQEEEASLFTTDTALPCDYNITEGVLNSDIVSENKSKITKNQWEFIHKVNISTEMFLVFPTYNIMILIMVMHSLLKINIQHYYNRNYKTCIGVYMTLSQPKAIK